MSGVFWLLGRKGRRRSVGAPNVFDDAMMARAIVLAREAASLGEVPVGAVVYKTETGEFLSGAHNRRELDNDPSAHAEHIAMRDAARSLGTWRLSGCSVVVTLEPCTMCAGLAVNSRVDRVVFGASDPKAGACGSLFRITEDSRLNHRPVTIGGVRADECGALLTEFFRALRTARE